MTRDDAIKIIHRLDAAFTYTQKLNEDFIRDEYINVLKNSLYLDCDSVIDNMIMDNRKELALPGELLEACRAIENDRKANQKAIEPSAICYICENSGVVRYKKNANEYMAYCNCDSGKQFAYNGRTNKKPEHRTDYIMKSVNEVFQTEEIEAMQTQNMFKSYKIVPCPEELKRILIKLGARI